MDTSFQSRFRDRSVSPGRTAAAAASAATAAASKLWPFNRSRSSSPNMQPDYNHQEYYSVDTNQARRASEQPGSSFVVKSVVRKSGGVSLPSSPDGKPAPLTGRGGSPSHRMRIEDSDSDSDNGPEAPSKLQYTRSRSKPLPSTTSLGVPPGGPGGGVGYGTARSYNDGRREPFHGEPAPRPAPQQRQRSPSPGNITARGFQQGLQDRGRSPRNSQSPLPGRTESPSARKPVARITAGPKSLAQQEQPAEQTFARPQSMAGPRQFPGSPASSQQQRFSSPMTPPSTGRVSLPSEPAPRNRLDSYVAPPFDAGTESPFGTVTPAGGQSPGFLSNFMTGDTSVDQTVSSETGGLAGKWLKNVFGKSPNEKQASSDWARDPRPFMDDTEQEARAQKMESMRQARQIVDAERHHHRSYDSPSNDSERASAEHEHKRNKSPPGRKPIPSMLPDAEQDGLSQLQNRLTPAQMIIQETRSRQMAREQMQAEREALIQTQALASRGPQTPTKDTSASPRTADRGTRFPSGAHQIVRQAAADSSTPTRAPAPATTGADISPGVGPKPLDAPLPHALQDMMDRFYKFERYSIPLLRVMETRLQELEREDGFGGKRRNQPDQMQMWVGQITNLMKHEIGQLRAATNELRQGRELVSDISRRTATSVQQPKPVVEEAPVKATFGFASESVSREREPARTNKAQDTPVPAQPLSHTRANPTPPAPLEDNVSTRSAESSDFEHTSSVENRLKALVDGRSTPSLSSASRSASSSIGHHDTTKHANVHEEDEHQDVPSIYASESSAVDGWTLGCETASAVSLALPMDKSASTSSCDTNNAPPLTPISFHSPVLRSDAAKDEPESEYASETIKLKSFQYFDTESVAAALPLTLKTSFDSPTAPSTGISPNKLYAKRFPAPATSTPSSPNKFTMAMPSVSTPTQLGLVERKRFTMPSPVGSPSNGLVRSNSFLNNNSAAAAIPNGPTSAAFSTARPIGHQATLQERVAFFNPRH